MSDASDDEDAEALAAYMKAFFANERKRNREASNAKMSAKALQREERERQRWHDTPLPPITREVAWRELVRAEDLPDHLFVYPRSANPFWRLDEVTRGTIGEILVERLRLRDPEVATVEATYPGAPYDLDETRANGNAWKLEVKLAMMRWNCDKQRWEVDFVNLHPGKHDVCYFLFCGLRTLYVFKGKATRTTEDYNATRKESNPEKAERQIVRKLREGKRAGHGQPGVPGMPQVAQFHLDDPLVVEALQHTSKAAAHTVPCPLSLLNSKVAGDLVEAVVPRALERMGAVWEAPTAAERGTQTNGTARGAHSAPFDGGLTFLGQARQRAEVKYAGGSTVESKRCTFPAVEYRLKDIKPGLHDVRLLCIRGPEGLHVFLHDNDADLVKHGKHKQLAIFCSDDTDANRRATCVKILAAKCHPLHLFIRFGEGDVEAMQRLIDGVA